MFAFKQSIFQKYKESFEDFLKEYGNELSREFYLPAVVDEMIGNNEGNVKLIETNEQWFGLTYKEDKKIAIEKIKEQIKMGRYPTKLW